MTRKKSTLNPNRAIKQVLVVLAALTLVLASGCKGAPFKCGLCGKESNGNRYKLTAYGESTIICEDCYNEAKKAKEELGR